jgi:hypothetical protein
MAAGSGLAEAIAELASLPKDAVERTVPEGTMLRLHGRLFRKPSRTPEEEEIVVAILSTWEEARAEGRAEGEANALLTVLRGRGIAVSDAARERILAERDPVRIERWIERALIATSLLDVLHEAMEPTRAQARGARQRTRG